MEELLNKLIEKWWKPFRESYINEYDFEFRNNWHTLVSCHSNEDDEYTNFDTYSWRDIVSKESWLWQFCCNQWLVDMHEWFYWQNIFHLDSKEYDYTDYQYWILESSLIDVDKLEGFILDNIKI